MRRKKLYEEQKYLAVYEEEDYVNTAVNTAAGTMRRKHYTIVYHGPRDEYEERMGEDYIPNTGRLGLSGPWRWVRTEAYSTHAIERLAVVPDSVHAWQWDIFDPNGEITVSTKDEEMLAIRRRRLIFSSMSNKDEEDQREDKKEEAQMEHSEFNDSAEGGGASSSGYSPEYKDAGPAAQRVLQAGMMFTKVGRK